MSLASHELDFDVAVFFDPESGVWCGQCQNAGIFTEGRTLDDLRDKVHEAVELLLEDLPLVPLANVHLRFTVEDVPFMPRLSKDGHLAHA